MPDGAVDGPVPERPIGRRERTGVLHPRNLERYAARWFEPGERAGVAVDQYWHVQWRLDEGECIVQRIIELPAVTLTVEEGDAYAPLVVTGVQGSAWTRRISGSGSAFGIRLRPAGLAALSDLGAEDVADATIPVTPGLDTRLYSLLSTVAKHETPEARVRAADVLIGDHLVQRPPSAKAILANTVLEELLARIRSRAGESLPGLGVSERTVQRALRATLGRGPKWVSRRIRLQEVARRLSTESHPGLAAIALELGYSDQAHLINDFRGVARVTPGAYVRALRAVAEAGLE